MKISSLRCAALMVEDGAFNHKIDYVTISKGIQIALLVQKVWHFVEFFYWWSFSGEGSASAACATGLLYIVIPKIVMIFEI